MSVRAIYDVWCDGPGPAGEGCLSWCTYATADSRREARKLATSGLWVYTQGDGDLCPACQARLAGSGREQR